MDIKFTLRHILTSKYKNGKGVHSPNMFKFFDEAIFSKKHFNYTQAENSRSRFVSSKEKILVTSAGAKGCGTQSEKKISDIAKNSSSYGKYGRLLQRIAAYLKPAQILELGTSLGIGTIYMASGYPQSTITTIEACPNTQKYATQNFETIGCGNRIVSINSDFDSILPQILSEKNFDLIYIDGNHTYDATLRYYELIKKYATENTVAIFDDINWSKGMANAWNDICNDQFVTSAVETLRMGIVFFHKNLTKKIYRTRF